MILQQQSHPVPVPVPVTLPLPVVDTVIQFCNQVALFGMKIFLFVVITVILFGRTTRSSKKTTSSSSIVPSSKTTKNGALLFVMFRKSLLEYLSLSSSSSFPTLFLQWHGWSHRLAGGMHLCWIIIGTIYVVQNHSVAVDSGEGNLTTESSVSDSWRYETFIYDMVLGCLGIITTMTASKDFPHKYVTNAQGQSGTLHSTAIVTQSEMIEHCFYQFLNLWQSLYLHTMSYYNDKVSYTLSNSQDSQKEPNSYMFGTMDDVIDLFCRLGMLWIVTSPWLVRHKLPVHSFSHNWKLYQRQRQQEEQQLQSRIQHRERQEKNPQEEEISQNKLSTKNRPNKSNRDDDIEILLYRIKKAQYIFYKHVILHGVNIYSILRKNTSSSNRSGSSNNKTIPHSESWRIFWLLLNLSYVMEFFLQSLVKRNILTQCNMLYFQRWLIVTASISAICVLIEIPHSHYYSYDGDTENNYYHSYYYYITSFWFVCFTSFVLNFLHRYHDVLNTMVIGTLLVISHVHCGAI